MKLSKIITILMVVLFSISIVWGATSKKQYRVVITSPYTNIYKELNPASPIIKIAYRDEAFELEHNGRKWYRVWINLTQTGLINKADAVIDSTGASLKMSTAGRVGVVAIIVIVLIGAVVVVNQFYFSKKNKNEDEDDDEFEI